MASNSKTPVKFKEISIEEISLTSYPGSATDHSHPDSSANCDSCLYRDIPDKAALYLCGSCDVYLCDACSKKHKRHEVLHINSDAADRERFVHNLIDEVKQERDIDLNLMEEDVSVSDYVNVKHDLDSNDCHIVDICGLGRKGMWAVTDRSNECLKIFELGSNAIQRYIKFGCSPYSVTEVHMKKDEYIKEIQMRENADQPKVRTRDDTGQQHIHTGGNAENQESDDTDPTKILTQCILAVLFPRQNQILLLDLTLTRVKLLRTLKTCGSCTDMTVYDNTIYILRVELQTILNEFVHLCLEILSLTGDVLKSIELPKQDPSHPHRVLGDLPIHLAVSPEHVFVSYPGFRKIIRMNHEGEDVTGMDMCPDIPEKLTVDDNGHVFVVTCCLGRNVKRVDEDFKGHRSVVGLWNKRCGYLNDAWSITCYRDKLFVGHFSRRLGSIKSRNFVTIIRLL